LVLSNLGGGQLSRIHSEEIPVQEKEGPEKKNKTEFGLGENGSRGGGGSGLPHVSMMYTTHQTNEPEKRLKREAKAPPKQKGEINKQTACKPAKSPHGRGKIERGHEPQETVRRTNQ